MHQKLPTFPAWNNKLHIPNRTKMLFFSFGQERLMCTNTKPDDAWLARIASRVRGRFMQSKVLKQHRCPTCWKVRWNCWVNGLNTSLVDHKFLGGGFLIQFRHAFSFLPFGFEPRFCHKCLHSVCEVPKCHDNQKDPTGNYLPWANCTVHSALGIQLRW